MKFCIPYKDQKIRLIEECVIWVNPRSTISRKFLKRLPSLPSKYDAYMRLAKDKKQDRPVVLDKGTILKIVEVHIEFGYLTMMVYKGQTTNGGAYGRVKVDVKSCNALIFEEISKVELKR